MHNNALQIFMFVDTTKNILNFGKLRLQIGIRPPETMTYGDDEKDKSMLRESTAISAILGDCTVRQPKREGFQTVELGRAKVPGIGVSTIRRVDVTQLGIR